MRGNVIDMAVGIIIGAAFGKIVDSLVKDIIMPPIGLLLGKVDFSNMYFVLKDGAVPAPYASLTAAQAAGAVTMNIGMFINAVISFLIVAFAVFLLIKGINELQAKIDAKEEKQEETKTKECLVRLFRLKPLNVRIVRLIWKKIRKLLNRSFFYCLKLERQKFYILLTIKFLGR